MDPVQSLVLDTSVGIGYLVDELSVLLLVLVSLLGGG